MEQPVRAGQTGKPWATAAVLTVVIGVLTWAAWKTDRPGHYWGDDFTLYLRQADSLFGRPDVGRVTADNHFMLDHSFRADFSPPLYPWGWPLILSIPVAVFGLDLDTLTIASLLSFAVFLAAWYRLAARRVPAVLALFGMVVVGTIPTFVGWTALLHSELPFMAAAFVTLVMLDRARGRWVESWQLGIAVGLLAAFAFSIRREGIALAFAIGLAQLIDGAFADLRRRSTAREVLAPAAAFIGFVGVLQLLLPSTLLPRYEGNTVANLVRFRGRYAGYIAQMFGSDTAVLGWLIIVGGALGWVLAVGVDWRKHSPTALYLVTVTAIGGSFFIPSTRYISTTVPLLVLGLILIPVCVGSKLSDPKVLYGVAAATLILLSTAIWFQARDLDRTVSSAENWGATVQDGPARADAVDMFDAVRTHTTPLETVGFFKARAMTLYTERRAVQIDERHPFDPASEFDVVVVRSAELSADDQLVARDEFDQIWTNGAYQILRPATIAG